MPNLGSMIGPEDTVYLVGGGRMGSALLNGWLAGGLAAQAVYVQEPQPSEALKKTGVHLVEADRPSGSVSVLVLAVKPQLAPNILPSLSALIGPDTLIVSLMAGRSLASLRSLCGGTGIYVRSMPNTPAMLGKGITALVCDQAISSSARDRAQALMASVGKTVWVENEAEIDAVTALSGSGPAYVFLLVEAMASAGEKLGLSPEIAMALARATIIGGGAMLEAGSESAAQLRENVTSPGGTTAAALSVLMGTQGLEQLMTAAMTAARDRAQELA